MNLNRTLSTIGVLCTVFVFASCAPVPRDFYKPAYKGGVLFLEDAEVLDHKTQLKYC